MDEYEKKKFMTAMGQRVRLCREWQKMSQEELAARLNYKNKASISRIEAGLNEIPQSKMRAFADALDTSIEYLMGWNETDYFYRKSETTFILSEEEKEIIRCYRSADARDKNTILNILGRYKEDTALSAG